MTIGYVPGCVPYIYLYIYIYIYRKEFMRYSVHNGQNSDAKRLPDLHPWIARYSIEQRRLTEASRSEILSPIVRPVRQVVEDDASEFSQLLLISGNTGRKRKPKKARSTSEI